MKGGKNRACKQFYASNCVLNQMQGWGGMSDASEKFQYII